MKKYLLVLFLILFCCGNVFALDKTSTGFYYPIGENNFDSACGLWLERDSGHGGCYFNGRYHTGVDMMTWTTTGEESEVYAVADGIVVYRHCSNDSWGPGNCALFIRHKLLNGDEFIALYGHLRTSLQQGDKVYAGKVIGRTGPYSGGIHLHFGLIPDNIIPGTNVANGIGWGRMGNQHWNESWPNKTNHFVDPIHFLNTHYPLNLSSYFWIREQNNEIIAWTPADVPCNKAKVWAYHGTCDASNSNPGICQIAYDELKAIDSDEYDRDFWRTIFFGSIEEFNQQCNN